MAELNKKICCVWHGVLCTVCDQVLSVQICVYTA
uniref:Uncharacterized protein n=1 Tax=Anguilla anguilla TaxID=7936 RepID=A0A0E9UCE9_ANGAN